MGGRCPFNENAAAFVILHRATCLWLELYVCVRVPIDPLISYRYPAIEHWVRMIPLIECALPLSGTIQPINHRMPVCHARSERRRTTVLPLESQAKLLERALPFGLDVLIIARCAWPGHDKGERDYTYRGLDSGAWEACMHAHMVPRLPPAEGPQVPNFTPPR